MNERIEKLEKLIPKLKANKKILPLKVECMEWEMRALKAEHQLKNHGVIGDVSGLFVLYREGAIDRIYWNGDEFQPYKGDCPSYSWEKANEYSKLLKCNFTDAE
jgi:hypothetical protein